MDLFYIYYFIFIICDILNCQIGEIFCFNDELNKKKNF